MVDQASKSPESVLTGRSQPPTSSVDRSLLARKDSVLSAAAARNTELPMKQKEKGRSKRAVMFFLVATLVVILIAICASITVSMVLSRWGWCTAIVQDQCPGGRASACLDVTCEGATTSTGDEEFRRRMLARHNFYREQPVNGSFAADMIRLKWSEQLEDAVLRWLHKLCRDNAGLRHDADECRQTVDFNSVGQNLWQGLVDRPPQWRDAALLAPAAWFGEIVNVSHDVPVFPVGRGTLTAAGRLTQMLWSRSYAVGCAYVALKLPQAGQSGKHLMWTGCNYAPAGNVMLEMTFRRAPVAGLACPQGTERAFDGLCTIDEEDDLRETLGVSRPE